MDRKNLFGQVIKDTSLRGEFLEPPFSVLNTASGSWQKRKNQWKDIGIKSELGKSGSLTYALQDINYYEKKEKGIEPELKYGTSIFDPVLCELLYKWFVPEGGKILDPFCGGSVRGIVANYMGYKYTGVDLRQEQIESNNKQALEILGSSNLPVYIIGDSNQVLDNLTEHFDFVFSCPPYHDLEVYSDLKEDLSNMDYDDFISVYTSIIKKSCSLLKEGSFACYVVGEIRDKKGNYRGFVPDTINAFKSCGMNYYNEGILLNVVASASLRARRNMINKKLCKIHQNILIFKK